eukprot:GFUD01018778.1.p1 GENE.GFUD01018778.1~~GFUD01018778.1.p1  ORF type:complete len:1425 (-),score=326.55 GFUD01018778.1:349-4623(-)
MDPNNSVAHIDSLTESAQFLIETLTSDSTDPDPDKLSQVLHTVQTVALNISVRDQELVMLTIRSILFRCVWVSEGGGLERCRVSIISTLLPLLRALDKNDNVLEQFIDSLVDKKVKCESWLSVLCALSEEIFPNHPVLFSKYFWTQIQSGLTHEDNLPRKRALYLMKRTVDTLFSNTCQAEDKSGLIFTDPAIFHKEKGFLGKDTFDAYFLILETLEEKQVHLVKQVLQKIQDLVKVSSNVLNSNQFFHSSWIMIAYLRLFKHPNIALVRWGLESFLNTSFDKQTLESENFLSFLCHPLMNVLNETKLYGKDAESNTFSSAVYFPDEPKEKITGQVIAKTLSNFLNSCFGKLEVEDRSNILRTFITSVSSKSWGPLPLVWITFALVDLETNLAPKCLTDVEMLNVRTLVDSHMVYQEPLLRGAAQANLLTCLLRFLDPKQCSYEEIASLLYTMWNRNVLFYVEPENEIWRKASEFVSYFFEKEFEKVFSVTKNVLLELKQQTSLNTKIVEMNVTKATLVMVLFMSDSNFDGAHVKQYNDMLLAKDDLNRPYASNRLNLNEEECTRIEHIALHSFLSVLKCSNRRSGKSFLHFSVEVNSLTTESVLSNLLLTEQDRNDQIKRLKSSLEICLKTSDIENIFRSEIYINLLSSLLEGNKQFQIDDDTLYELFLQAFTNFSEGSMIQRVIALKIIKKCSLLHVSTSIKNKVNNKLQSLLLSPTIISNLMSESERENDIQNREDQKLWGRLCSEFQRDQLEILNYLVACSPSLDQQMKIRFLEKLTETLEVGGKECLVVCVDMALTLGLPCEQFLEVAKRFIFEFRKNEIFWPALESYVRLCLENLELSSTAVKNIFIDLIHEAENVSGIFPLLIVQLENFFSSKKDSFNFLTNLLPVIAKALTFGQVYRKDQKLVTDTNQVIYNLGTSSIANYLEGSDHLMDGRVRIGAINIILSVSKVTSKEKSSSLIMELFEELQAINVEITGKRTRHFENSLIHKVRQRIYQCYVMFSPLLESKDSEQVLSELCKELLTHSQQTSVRYYSEWAAIIIIVNNSQFFCRMWDWLSKAASEKIGSIPSFLVIITQYLSLCKDVDKEALELAIKEISPWCMAQHFGTRIVAQICFRKIWKICEKSDFGLVEKYEVLKDCIAKSVNPSNSDKISEDFYLTIFDPLAHLTFEDILYEFPRLCEISEEELIPRSLIETLTNSYIPSVNPGSTLSGCKKEKPAGPVAKDDNRKMATNQNVQKKITPWKSMLTDSDIGSSNRFSDKSTRAHEDLIVVASLIDKAPNLGGLCRTSEILGVGSLVLHSKSVTKDKEFSAVSVTAENWVPILECAPHKLEQYLGEKKREGFTIVAVEQAKESIMLQDYKFPKKCVFLLGKEKEGVPVELLNQVDVCIEIPQSGLIRSFNVHVTGALVLWEYVKQHSN